MIDILKNNKKRIAFFLCLLLSVMLISIGLSQNIFANDNSQFDEGEYAISEVKTDDGGTVTITSDVPGNEWKVCVGTDDDTMQTQESVCMNGNISYGSSYQPNAYGTADGVTSFLFCADPNNDSVASGEYSVSKVTDGTVCAILYYGYGGDGNIWGSNSAEHWRDTWWALRKAYLGSCSYSTDNSNYLYNYASSNPLPSGSYCYLFYDGSHQNLIGCVHKVEAKGNLFFKKLSTISGINSQTKTYGIPITLSTTIPTKEGYTFLGWSDTKGESTPKWTSGSQYELNEGKTLYPVWGINTYNIQFDANGGTDAPNSVTKTHGTDLSLPTKTPKLAGSKFLGWSTNKSDTTAMWTAGGTYTLESSNTLYAIWKSDTYKITYNANGGTGAPATDAKRYNESFTLSGTVPTRTGYVFKGWATSSSATTPEYQPKGKYSDNADLDLYAVWEKETYSVTYNANAGTDTVTNLPDSQTKIYGEDLTLSAAEPARSAYNFTGWNTKADGTGTSYTGGTTYTDNAALTLYAQWSLKTYSVTYNANAGTDTVTNLPSTQTKTYGTALALSSNVPVRTGYNFKEWNTQADGTGTSYTAGSNYTDNADLDLYAQWSRITYTIKYDANGGTGAPSSQTKIYGTTLVLSSTVPTRTGYTFTGWNTEQDGSGTTYSAGDNYTANSGATLYAQWKTNTYIVSYDANAGSDTVTNLPAAQEKIHGTTLTLSSNTPTRSGYDFDGWNTKADGTGTSYKAGSNYTNNAAITLYAQWTVNKTAKAILTADGVMTFVYDSTTYTVGESFSTISGNSTISNVYDIPDEITIYSNIPWYGERLDVITVNIENNFYDYKPASTAYWFAYLKNASNMMNMQNIDTSSVTNMEQMFYYSGHDASEWNVNGISNWDTSKVENMSQMFSEAGYTTTIAFNLDLSKWDTSNVTNMNSMFYFSGRNASPWSVGDLSDWNTKNVKYFSSMFRYTGYSSTTWDIGDLSKWDTSNATTMFGMFAQAGNKETSWSVGDLSNWNTSNVTNMCRMFESQNYTTTTWSVGDISSWNTSKVTDMSYMFSGAGTNNTEFNIDLSKWDTLNVTNMSSMFADAGNASTNWSIGDISSWDTSKVTNMSYMFYYAGTNASSFSIDLSQWDTSKVTSFSSMFYNAGSLSTTWNVGDISKWNTSSAKNMSDMFRNSGNSTTIFSLDLSGWNTSNVTDMSSMFYNSKKLTTIYVGNEWSTAAVTSPSYMFSYCTSLVGGAGTAYNSSNTNATYARVDTSSTPGYLTPVSYTVTLNKNGGTGSISTSVTHTSKDKTTYSSTSYPGQFAISELPASGLTKDGYTFLGWNTTSDATTALTGTYTASGSDTLYAVWEEEVSGTAKAILTADGVMTMLYDDKAYTVGDSFTSNIGASTISAVYNVPENAEGTSDIPWYNSDGRSDITSINVTSSFSGFKPTSTGYWFYKLKYVTSITGMEYLNTSSLTSMRSMFNYAGYNANTFNISDMSKWDTSKVTSMRCMFQMMGYTATTWSIGDLSGWDTSEVTDMSYMFYSAAYKATTWSIGDLSGWDTSEATDMSYMFNSVGYSSTTWDIGDISNWNTSKVTNMSYMFFKAGYSATTWTIDDLSGWNTSKVTDMSYMFKSAGYAAETNWTIKGLSNWDVSKVTNMKYMFDSTGASTKIETTSWSLDLSGWNISKVTNMTCMFAEAGHSKINVSLNISGWNTSSLIYAGQIFYFFGAYSTSFKLTGVSDLDMSNVTTTRSMFYYAGYNQTSSLNQFTLDLSGSGWDTSKVTDMTAMFKGCNRATKIYVSNKWSTAAVTASDNMFQLCSSVSGAISHDSSKTDATYANYTTGYLTYKASTSSLEESELLTTMDESETTYTVTFDANGGENAPNVQTKIENVDLTLDNSVPTREGFTFKGWAEDSSVTEATWHNGLTYSENRDITLYAVWENKTAKAILGTNNNLNFVYDNGVYVVGQQYNDNLELTEIAAIYTIPLNSDINVIIEESADGKISEKYDQNNEFVERPGWINKEYKSLFNEEHYFYNDTITSVNFDSSFAGYTPRSINGWFAECYNISNFTGLNNLNTAFATDMSYVFKNTGIDATSDDTVLDLSTWNTSNVTTMSGIFENAFGSSNVKKLILNVSNWNTEKVTDMSFAFSNLGYYEPTLLSGVNGESAQEIVVTGLENWNTLNVQNMTYMFDRFEEGCPKTTKIDLSKWNVQNVHMFSNFNNSVSEEKLVIPKFLEDKTNN